MANKSVLDYITMLQDKMLETMASLPKVKTVDEVIAGMSPRMREQMSFSLGPAFQAGLYELTEQELEAVKKMREIHLRLSLYHNMLELEAVMAPQNLDTALESVHHMQKVAKKWDAKLEGPYADVSRFIQAQITQKLAIAVAKGMGPENVEGIQTAKLLMANVMSDIQAQNQKPEAPSAEVNDQHDDIDDDSVDAEYVELGPDDDSGDYIAQVLAEANGRKRHADRE
jgi:hypothetical protein